MWVKRPGIAFGNIQFGHHWVAGHQERLFVIFLGHLRAMVRPSFIEAAAGSF
jgi:hypothetical protein